ncbi:hypothetical protein B0H13DRAFT_1871844 [Mycena leptocephala]|nr:hypothetical protein B0H13DRAFT_1871844 [Mycena leptocephala]
MSRATPFLHTASLHDVGDGLGPENAGEEVEVYERNEVEFGWIRIRILSHREAKNLDASTRGVLHEASAACTKIMRLAQALERRTNAEQRLTRRSPPRRDPTSVVHHAVTSTVPSVNDGRSCRVATVRPARSPPPHPLDLVRLVADITPTASLPTTAAYVDPIPAHGISPHTFTDTFSEAHPSAVLCDVAVDATLPHSSRSFASIAVSTSDVPDNFSITEKVKVTEKRHALAATERVITNRKFLCIMRIMGCTYNGNG